MSNVRASQVRRQSKITLLKVNIKQLKKAHYRFQETRQGSTPRSVNKRALAAYRSNRCLRPVS